MSTRLSLEASKKIFELVGEYETEKCYLIPPEGCFGATEPIEWGILGDDLIERGYSGVPAPSFSELVRVMPKIGVKKQWGIMPERSFYEARISPSHHSMMMVEMYMSSPTEPEGMAAVERYLMEILK